MEKALLVSVFFTDSAYRDSWPPEESTQELRELIASSGVEVIESLIVHRDRPSPAHFIGKGKVEEIRQRSQELSVGVVIFGEDLNPQQQRNLEDKIQVKVIDRTQLILDIFAQRAHSQEGKVQVELAQLSYLLPRLTGTGVLLSRLGGGIGTRGPGEQKLEVDRRRIRLRMSRLKNVLDQIRKRRNVARQKRREEEIPTVALIGYTNVGKTTLLNTLTHANATAQNRLFTTLDPLSRRLTLPNHQSMLLTDTVGFLHRLPHHLVEAFRATLEEVTESRFLLHLRDASHSRLEEQATAVHEVLKSLDAENKTQLIVFNKIDQADPLTVERLRHLYPEALFISATSGHGIPELLDRLSTLLNSLTAEAVIWLSPVDHHWLERIYAQGQVLSHLSKKDQLQIRARIPPRLFGQLAKAGLLSP